MNLTTISGIPYHNNIATNYIMPTQQGVKKVVKFIMLEALLIIKMPCNLEKYHVHNIFTTNHKW